MDLRGNPEVAHLLQTYRVWDDARREVTPPTFRSGAGSATVPLGALASSIACEVARIRRHG